MGHELTHGFDDQGLHSRCESSVSFVDFCCCSISRHPELQTGISEFAEGEGAFHRPRLGLLELRPNAHRRRRLPVRSTGPPATETFQYLVAPYNSSLRIHGTFSLSHLYQCIGEIWRLCPFVLCCCWLGDRKGIRFVKGLASAVFTFGSRPNIIFLFKLFIIY